METAPATLKALRGGDKKEHPGFEQAGSIDAGKPHGDPRDFRVNARGKIHAARARNCPLECPRAR
jgi:hypothetical protein